MKVGTDGILLGAWCELDPATNQSYRILDIGTGCGLIALMLAQRSESKQRGQVVAVEIDSEAASQAAENFQNSPWRDRIQLVNAAIQDFVEDFADAPFDLIVSNPPFFQKQLRSPTDTRNLARHDNGLPVEAFWASAIRILAPSGRIALIIPCNLLETHVQLAASFELRPVRLTRVRPFPRRDAKRSLIEFGREGILHETELVVEAARHQYTPEFKRLTAGFYLKHPD